MNQSIAYSDDEGNTVIFPSPRVTVDCGIVITPEPCPVPVDITIGGCQDAALMDAGNTYLESLGRILQLDVTIKNVCPDKRVALAAILTEIDPKGNEHSRGVKTMAIPAHHSSHCRDILVKCISFVLPEELDVSGGTPKGICNPRKFKARFIAHYIDTNYRCCDPSITIL